MLGHARVTREGGTRWWETLPIQVLPSFVGVAHSRRLIIRGVLTTFRSTMTLPLHRSYCVTASSCSCFEDGSRLVLLSGTSFYLAVMFAFGASFRSGRFSFLCIIVG